MMMEDLTMLDAIYTTDAEMADYDFDYDIPESVMQDDAVPTTTTTDEFDYTSAQVQEYDMLEDGHENYSGEIVVPTAENVIGAEPVQITEVAIPNTVGDIASTESIVQVEPAPETHVAPTLVPPLPTPSQDQPLVRPATTPGSSSFEAALPLTSTPKAELPIAPGEADASVPVASGEQVEPPTGGSPKEETNKEPLAPQDPPSEIVKDPSTASLHAQDPSDAPIEPTPDPLEPAEERHVIDETSVAKAALDAPYHQPIVFYYCDQPYPLFTALPNSGQVATSQNDNFDVPTVLLSGKSELLTQPLASLFKSIREQEQANFSWISEQYVIGLEYAPLELYIDESSSYTNEISLSDLCRAVSACGHELMEFTLYQADDFKYLLNQRLQGIPPPLPEGSAESQEEEDTVEYHTQQISTTRDDEYPEVPQAPYHEPNYDAATVLKASTVDLSLQSAHATEGVDDASSEEGLEEAEYDDSHPTEATSNRNHLEDEEHEGEFDPADLNDDGNPAGTEVELDGAIEVTKLHEQEQPDHKLQVQPLTSIEHPEHSQQAGDNISAAEDAPQSNPGNEADYPDDVSDGTLESSQHDAEEYVAEDDEQDGDGEVDDTDLNQPPFDATEGSTSDTDESKGAETQPLDSNVLHTADDSVQELNHEESTNEWNGTEPSEESAAPDDFDEYSYYDEADPGYEEDEPTEDHDSQANPAEEATVDRASLIDFKEDITHLARAPPSPPSKGKRALSEVDEVSYQLQYTDQDPHADPKRARVE